MIGLVGEYKGKGILGVLLDSPIYRFEHCGSCVTEGVSYKKMSIRSILFYNHNHPWFSWYELELVCSDGSVK